MSKRTRKLPRGFLFSAFTAVCLTGCMGEKIETAAQQQEEYQAPRFTISNDWSIAANAPDFDGFVTVDALDYDGGEMTYGLDLSGHDAQFFHVDLQTGLLGFINPPDYENPQDEDGDNRYNITLIACDSRGGCSEFQMSVWVKEAYRSPTEASGVPFFIERQIDLDLSYDAVGPVHTLQALNLDGGPMFFRQMEGFALEEYEVNPNSGEVSLLRKPDADKPGDTLILVVANESGSEAYGTVNIRYHDGDLPPGNIDNPSAPEFISAPEVNVAAGVGTNVFYTASAQDRDGQAVTYFLQAGNGYKSRFDLDADSGELRFASDADYQALLDSTGGSSYLVLGADDGYGKRTFLLLRLRFD